MLYASKYGYRIPEWAIEKDLGELYEHWLLLFISKNRRRILVAMLKSSLTHRIVIKEEEKDH